MKIHLTRQGILHPPESKSTGVPQRPTYSQQERYDHEACSLWDGPCRADTRPGGEGRRGHVALHQAAEEVPQGQVQLRAYRQMARTFAEVLRPLPWRLRLLCVT